MSEPRVVVVTGGASGMGRGTGEVFAAAGDWVVLADIDSNLGRRVAEEIEGTGSRATFHDLDVTDEESIDRLVEWTESEIGPIDILVNSAGILQNPMSIVEMPMEDHDRMWRVNNRGLYLCCRAVAPRMKSRGRGCMINIASSTSFNAWPLTAYAPGKAAVKMLTEVLAGELGPSGIRVNAVAPHITPTPPSRPASIRATATPRRSSPSRRCRAWSRSLTSPKPSISCARRRPRRSPA